MTPLPASKTAATSAVTVGPNIPPRLRVLFGVLLGTIPLAWLGAWWSQDQDDRLGVPDVAIAAPDNKPVLSLDYDPNHADRLLIAAGDDMPGGGAILWESTDKADSDLPLRDAGAFGRVPVRSSRTLRAYGKGGGSVARFSPDGIYIATNSTHKLTVWRNDGYHSVPLHSVETTLPSLEWRNVGGRTALIYRSDSADRDGFALLPETGKRIRYNFPTRTLSLHARPCADNGTDLACGDNRLPGTIYLFSSQTAKPKYVRDAGAAFLTCLVFSIDGKQLAAGDAHGWVYRFERNSDGKFVPARKWPRFAHAQNPGPAAPRVTALAFSPDGKTLATGGTDGAVFLWRL